MNFLSYADSNLMARILKKRRKLLLVNRLSPGDIVMMTAAVRDLHRAFPNEYFTDVLTSAQELWDNNPFITKLAWRAEPLPEGQTEAASEKEVVFPKHKIKIIKEDPDLEVIEVNYHGDYPGSINKSNSSAYHFIHGCVQDLGKSLGVHIPVTDFRGDIYISELEKSWISQVQEMGINDQFWIMMAGGKNDFTAKWWNPASYQKVVDLLQDRVLFLQCGEKSHFHQPLDGVIGLVGKTNIRQFIRLVYHSDGIVCGVTFAMHLAAAVPMKQFDNKGRSRPPQRACVVVAGGREPTHWEAYPNHQFLHSIGALPCCAHGGCWKGRCQLVGDGDAKDTENVCVDPVQVTEQLRIPRCMDMISAEQVVKHVNIYLSNGLFHPLEKPVVFPASPKQDPVDAINKVIEAAEENVAIATSAATNKSADKKSKKKNSKPRKKASEKQWKETTLPEAISAEER